MKRKITEKIAGILNPKEVFVYFALALHCDINTYESYIKQETLYTKLKIKKETLIKYLKKYEINNLLRIEKFYPKGSHGVITRNKYILNTEHFNFIDDKLFDESISPELMGFLILIKSKCLNTKNYTLYNKSVLAESLNISRPTFTKYFNEAVKWGYILEKDGKIELLRDDIFYNSKDNLSTFTKQYLDYMLSDDEKMNLGSLKVEN